MYGVSRNDFTMRINDFVADADKPRHDFKVIVADCLCQAGVDINSQKLLRVKRLIKPEGVCVNRGDWQNNWHFGCCLISCIVILVMYLSY